ncbi:Lactate utilization protein B/C (plasmid) [Deinococcus proteolyticus MRP]|uniref:Lactate utilization protein B/C n=1 Tax=Deinococcus proteolyticus (strain ATCC 35074 / DSM 20540 / JCM 6276 / NBRC 101906 / NCIMB 13154 / VKM Ac-1939 / CCM 2703 / MRP) TaxID=693977 RepID=F0RPR9_DEIPM|nr:MULTISPECIES: lactate utilization protein C [Deinococcus]ADY27375.1 Lactate utilization protein B/C [Deinococcus proteolyticus MRP]MCY1704248.1 lactate utilization protein C [Deinococcus sp. SL84]
MSHPKSVHPHNAEARLEMLTVINRAIAGAAPVEKPPYPRPQPLSAAEREEQFRDRILDYRAHYTRVPLAELPQAIAAALGRAQRVLVPAGIPADWLPAGLEQLRDEPRLSHAQLDRAEAVVTGCAVAVSETGTICLDHGAGQGRRALSLIPDLHVCVVRENQIVQTVRGAVERLGPAVRAGRPLTWLSGGSATSDIELVRVEGVHGPRALHVIVVAE